MFTLLGHSGHTCGNVGPAGAACSQESGEEQRVKELTCLWGRGWKSGPMRLPGLRGGMG